MTVYSFGRAALLLLVEVYNHTVPVRERGRIRVKFCEWSSEWDKIMAPLESIIKQQQLNYLFAWQPAAFANDSLRVLLRSKDLVIVI